VPQDLCGKIRIEVRDAVADLLLTEVSKRTLREIVSAEANASGCTQQWADMVWVETTQRGGDDWAAPGAEPLPGGEIRLCIYRVPESEQRGGKPAGTFERGIVLSANRWASIKKALKQAGPARDCTTPAASFALLRSADGDGATAYVDLDGCRRILVTPLSGPPSLTQGDAALVRLLVSTT
jgi:hypothetical protein